MPPRAALAVPTSSSLPSSLRLPSSHPAVSKPLSKLSRPSLVSLVQEWLRARNQAACGPFLGGEDIEDDSIYNPARTLDELREVYRELGARKGGKREVVDRVLEGDWRHGLSLRQLAMVDVQHLIDHPTSMKWTSLKLVKVAGSAEDSGYETSMPSLEDELPRFHGPAFLSNLQKEVGPFMKTHYHLIHLSTLPITLLRIYLHDSPYNSPHSLAIPPSLQTPKSVLVAFPDNSPFVYISQSGSSSGDWKHLHKLIIDAIPKAFSRPKSRWMFKMTSLTARSLAALVASRGGGKTNSAGGGWSTFAEGTVEQSPLRPSEGSKESEDLEPTSKCEGDPSQVKPGHGQKRLSDSTDAEDTPHMPAQKRRKLLAERRFGESALPDDGTGLERLQIRVEDAFPGRTATIPGMREASSGLQVESTPRKGRRSALAQVDGDGGNDAAEGEAEDDDGAGAGDARTWRPQVEMTFHGSHIFAGMRQLVESGAIDGNKMPGWMTGEEGVSIGVVRNGRIRGRKGAGV